MDSVTLVLPVGSYGPLYALAKAGGLFSLASERVSNPTWTPLQAPVLDGLSQFTASW
jgi:hypothetical protein